MVSLPIVSLIEIVGLRCLQCKYKETFLDSGSLRIALYLINATLCYLTPGILQCVCDASLFKCRAILLAPTHVILYFTYIVHRLGYVFQLFLRVFITFRFSQRNFLYFWYCFIMFIVQHPMITSFISFIIFPF